MKKEKTDNVNDKSKKINPSNFLGLFLTCCLVIIAFQQYKISDAQRKLSYELAGITKAQEDAKIRTAKKELRDISRDITIMFPRGIKNHMSENVDNDFKIIQDFSALLNRGFDNYCLAQNKTYSDKWTKAMRALDTFLIMGKLDAMALDKEAEKTFIGAMTASVETAWKEIFDIYLQLGANLQK